jgi:membrane fusion protein, multidrug efflux system
MPDEWRTDSLRSDTAAAPAARRTVPQEEWELPAERSRAPEESLRPSRRRWLRWALFLLLPLALIVGAYFYFEGGAYMLTDDAYIKADEVGLSTDVSGMVEAIEVSDNQHVTAGQVLFRLDPLPFQLKLDQAQSQLGVVRDNLNALKANYQNVQAQIRHAEDQIAFDQLQDQRQQILARQQFTPQTAVDQARLNLQASQQTLASDKAQLASIVANLDGNPDIPIEQPPQDRQALAQRDEAGPATARYRCQGAVQRHRDQRPLLGAGNVSAGLDHCL